MEGKEDREGGRKEWKEEGKGEGKYLVGLL